MKILKKATNIEFTPAIDEYLAKHLIAHIERLVDTKDESATVALEVGKTSRHHNKGDVFRAEVNLHISGSNLRAEAERDDLHMAIDEVREEIVRELTKNKKRRFDLLKRGGQKLKDLMRGISGN